MGDLREIVEQGTVEHLFLLLGILGPVVGLALGAALGSRRQRLRQGMLNGLLIGLLGTLNWLLWRVYNSLTDANGLDSVKGLAINLVLFVGVGMLLGVGYVAWQKKNIQEK